jgi:hypothetical protein
MRVSPPQGRTEGHIDGTIEGIQGGRAINPFGEEVGKGVGSALSTAAAPNSVNIGCVT